jgi:lipopolysaccharide assembly outer membrane protein LptD (OstA)
MSLLCRIYAPLIAVLWMISSSASSAALPPPASLHKADSVTAVGDTLVKKPPPVGEKPDTAAADTLTNHKKTRGVTDTVYYSAEGGYIDYDVENKKMKLIHNAMVKYQDITLNADSITYLIDDGLLIATGKPQLVEKADTTVGESMIYNIKTKRGRVRYASAHMDDAYFNGTKIVKTEDNALYIDEGDYTTCALIDTPDYFFYGQNVKVVPEDKIISRPVVFALGGAPVAALPFFIFPLERNRQSGFLTPSWGGHPESGGYIDNLGYYFVPNDYVDFMAWTRVSEFRDFVLNGSSRYSKKYMLNGSISGRYALQGDYLARSNNWSIDYYHNQNITPDNSFTLSGRGSLLGTQSFYRTFSEDSAELLDQSINANLSLSKRFTGINASASATWNRSQNLRTNVIQEDLPSLSFSLPSRAFIPFVARENLGQNEKDEPAWYNKVNYSYGASALRRSNTSPNDSGQNFHKSGISQQANLSAPLSVLKYFTISPNFNAQLSSFDSYMDTSAYDTSFVTDTTFDTVTLAEREKFTPDTFPVVDIYITPNRNSLLNDTTYKIVKSTNQRKIPKFMSHDKWTSDFSWNAGASLSTILYGMFPIHIFNFTGLRHILTPSLSYTYTPKHDLDKKFYNVVSNASPKAKPSQSVSISLSNELQGKTVSKPANQGEKPVENKFQILSANIGTSYDFEAPVRKWSDLSLGANTSYNIVRVTYGSSFWMYDQNDKQVLPLLKHYTVTLSTNTLGASGTFWEGDKIVLDSLQPPNDIKYRNAGPQKWSASISPSYTFSQSRATPLDPFVTTKNYSLSTSAGLAFTRNWDMSWSSTYNFVTNQLVGHDIRFHYSQDCWELRFDWRPSGYNPGYYFIVNIKKIPEIKWENRG